VQSRQEIRAIRAASTRLRPGAPCQDRAQCLVRIFANACESVEGRDPRELLVVPRSPVHSLLLTRAESLTPPRRPKGVSSRHALLSASGKGLPAALLMARLQATILAFVSRRGGSGASLAEDPARVSRQRADQRKVTAVANCSS
jgi:hypothetical protein